MNSRKIHSQGEKKQLHGLLAAKSDYLSINVDNSYFTNSLQLQGLLILYVLQSVYTNKPCNAGI